MIVFLGFQEINDKLFNEFEDYSVSNLELNSNFDQKNIFNQQVSIEPCFGVFKLSDSSQLALLENLIENIDLFWIEGNVDIISDLSEENKDKFCGILSFDEKQFGVSKLVICNMYDMVQQQKVTKLKEKVKLENLVDNYQEVLQHLEKKLKTQKDAFTKYRDKSLFKLKAFEFYYQFKIGVNPGAEYCEFFELGDSIYMVHFSTTKYSESSLFLAYLEQLKFNNNSSSIDDVYNNLIAQLEDFYKDEKEVFDVSLFLMEVKHKKLNAEIINIGSYQFFSNRLNHYISSNAKKLSRENLAAAKQTINLERGEKFVLLSPGYIKNIEGDIGQLELKEFVEKHIDMAGKDIIDELLIKLTSPSETFTQNDAHILFGEVSSHAISEI